MLSWACERRRYDKVLASSASVGSAEETRTGLERNQHMPRKRWRWIAVRTLYPDSASRLRDCQRSAPISPCWRNRELQPLHDSRTMELGGFPSAEYLSLSSMRMYALGVTEKHTFIIQIVLLGIVLP